MFSAALLLTTLSDLGLELLSRVNFYHGNSNVFVSYSCLCAGNFTPGSTVVSTAVSSIAATMVTSSVMPLVSPALSVVSAGAPGSPATIGLPAGAYLGEGLLPVPEKLAQKILHLDFVEMRELVPETLAKGRRGSGEEHSSMAKASLSFCDIHFAVASMHAVMVGVLSRVYPTMVPEFMSYQAITIKCAQDFDGLAWTQYDRAYRRQVAQTKDLRWFRLNPTLYSLCSAGKAK